MSIFKIPIPGPVRQIGPIDLGPTGGVFFSIGPIWLNRRRGAVGGKAKNPSWAIGSEPETKFTSTKDHIQKPSHPESITSIKHQVQVHHIWASSQESKSKAIKLIQVLQVCP